MVGGGSVKEVKSKAELDKLLSEGAPVALHFWASWCEASKQMDQVFSHLSTDFPHAHFLKVIHDFSLCVLDIYLLISFCILFYLRVEFEFFSSFLSNTVNFMTIYVCCFLLVSVFRAFIEF